MTFYDKFKETTYSKRLILIDLPAETLPGITFREVEVVSSLSNWEVALLAEGTEFLSLNTRVILTITDPLLQCQRKQKIFKTKGYQMLRNS